MKVQAVEHFRGTNGNIFINAIKDIVSSEGQPTGRFGARANAKGDMYPFIFECGKVTR